MANEFVAQSESAARMAISIFLTGILLCFYLTAEFRAFVRNENLKRNKKKSSKVHWQFLEKCRERVKFMVLSRTNFLEKNKNVVEKSKIF